MPYKSVKQERFFHTDTAKKKGIAQETVNEFDQASKGLKLPMRKDPAPTPVTPNSKSHWRK